MLCTTPACFSTFIRSTMVPTLVENSVYNNIIQYSVKDRISWSSSSGSLLCDICGKHVDIYMIALNKLHPNSNGDLYFPFCPNGWRWLMGGQAPTIDGEVHFLTMFVALWQQPIPEALIIMEPLQAMEILRQLDNQVSMGCKTCRFLLCCLTC